MASPEAHTRQSRAANGGPQGPRAPVSPRSEGRGLEGAVRSDPGSPPMHAHPSAPARPCALAPEPLRRGGRAQTLHACESCGSRGTPHRPPVCPRSEGRADLSPSSGSEGCFQLLVCSLQF